MSLVEDIKTALTNDFDVSELTIALPDIKLEEDEIVDTGRWFIYHRAVFARHALHSAGHIYAALEYSEPATEMQEADGEPVEVYAVEPFEVTVTKYRKV